MSNREAVRAALREALLNDDRVLLMGEDVGAYGGAHRVSLGLLEEVGPERIRDAPLSENGFTGAGIGAALGGMRTIVEIMTVNFSLLALDQVLNNAATLLHLSGGQCNVPLVIRMTTGAGRQLAAQHSHSLEAWYAHIPGIRVVAPATLEDARGMLAAALENPTRWSSSSTAASTTPRASSPPVRVPWTSTVPRYGAPATTSPSSRTAGHCAPPSTPPSNSPPKASERTSSTSARCARSTTRRCSTRSPRTHRAVVVDEGWRSVGLAAEISARVTEQAFYELDARSRGSARRWCPCRTRVISNARRCRPSTVWCPPPMR